MRANPFCSVTVRTLLIAATAAVAIPATRLGAQDPARAPATTASTLTVSAARDSARRVSPELTAAREAVAAAAARERQSSAFPNPALSYQREQTSGAGQTNSQNIASVDQPIELGGLRSARSRAAMLRREAAEARLVATEAQLDLDVTRAYALAVAAERRATLARHATFAFARARSVSETRFAEGDVSGYAHRRISLEAARYAGLLAEALLAERTARLTLASLVGTTEDSLGSLDLTFDVSLAAVALAMTPDSLRGMAARHRADLRVAILEAEAAAADARLVSRGRLPLPILSAGLKTEHSVGAGDFSGFVAGVSLPLPLWDRRQGAIEAAGAEARREVAQAEIVRRRVAREVDEAVAGLRAIDEQLGLLRPQLGAESEAALNAAQVAYSEGEISLVEWLDAVRAYQEAESTYASLRAESIIRRAALDRAVGVSLSRESR